MSVRRRKEPIHSVFQVCSQLTPDPTWKDFLKECAYGYFPTGVKFSNGNLVCSRKKNSFTIEIPTDPEKALPVLISIFRDRLGIKSVREKKSENLVFEKLVRESIFQSWSEVKTKAGKHSLINNYVEAMSVKFCMNRMERNRALALLEICITSNVIGKNQIHVKDGKIIGVEGFYFDPLTREVFFTGKISRPAPVLFPEPLFYEPKKQLNFPGIYVNALEEHSNKIKQAVAH